MPLGSMIVKQKRKYNFKLRPCKLVPDKKSDLSRFKQTLTRLKYNPPVVMA